ncbi:MAG TPA: ATP-binding protein [Candidatus Solibacter sp.]|nr:ATP-binding protein [Candidatus Solibacter sp.]
MATVAPITLTAAFETLHRGSREYVFVYLAVVAFLGFTYGLGPALVAAVASFFLIDYAFVPPFYTFTLIDEQDAFNLASLIAAAVLVSRRRSQQRRAEAVALLLEDANVELSRLNREQAAAAEARLDLALANERLENLARNDQMRQRFLADISHDLRTPITSIITAGTAALEDQGLDPETRRSLRTGVAEAWRLNRLVRDMLDLARIDEQAIELEVEALDLAVAVRAAADRVEADMAEPRVEVDLDEEILVLADWDRLGQILDNLLSNADKFAPRGSRIWVSAVPDLNCQRAVVRVRDQGPGVPYELRSSVFDRFVKGVDSLGGTGLGLAIVRGLVEAHGGTVELETANEVSGASFAFTLPLAFEGA